MFAFILNVTTNNKVIVGRPTKKTKWNQKIPQLILEKAQRQEMAQVYKSNCKIVYLNPTTSPH